MKIKLHSHYNHFPEHVPEGDDKFIHCYNDSFVRDCEIEPNSIALLIEPRPLQPKIYEFIQENSDKFKIVFTHDSILLNSIPNAMLIIWGGVWSWGNEQKDFDHPISMVASWKEEAPVRIERKHLAQELKDKIDCYGTFDGGKFVSTHDIYAKYPFSVVIENYIDDYWITEKVCNCFANNTIPIYWGARKIDQLFDSRGMFIANSIEDVKLMVDYLLVNGKSEYMQRKDFIAENRKRVKTYENFETWFFNQYGEMLDEIIDNNTVL